ncbi:MAG TPA: DinB family protein [Pirellulales bacterium]|jgi:uncharacterized damage-inducible protein DinB|nr:DinB family protein [Pirellulales bacterium]
MDAFIADINHDFQRHKRLADAALAELADDAFFRKPGEVVNPVALIVKHLGGNLLSRWTDFLSTDGEKSTRNRDSEFVLTPQDTRAALMQRWEAGWSALLGTLHSLHDADLGKTITIRGEAHTVQQALIRGLTHAAYHTGQILYLARLFNPTGTWQTVAPGQSSSHQAAYRKS